MTDSQQQQVAGAIAQAAALGHITPGSSQTLLKNLGGSNIPRTIGTQIPLMESVIPLILNLVVDITGSLSGFEKIIEDAINDTLDDFDKMKEKTGQEMYVRITAFSILPGMDNVRVLQDFIHIQDCPRLLPGSLDANGETPLYEASFEGITATSTFGASAFAYGAQGVQEVTVILSDGQEFHPGKKSVHTIDELRRFLKELSSKSHFTCAFVGIGDDADFHQVALDMGILDGNILTVDKTKGGITKALKLVSSSVGAKSQAKNPGQKMTSGNFFQT